MQPINLLRNLPSSADDELFETLLTGGAFKLDRIISTGQPTPTGQWYDQDEDEWVLLLSGAAKLRFEDEAKLVELAPGDALLIPAHHRHRVEWTSPTKPTVWLAIHFVAGSEAASRNM